MDIRGFLQGAGFLSFVGVSVTHISLKVLDKCMFQFKGSCLGRVVFSYSVSLLFFLIVK